MKDIKDYCKSRCQTIIKEYDAKTIEYYRGLYKGYSFCIAILINNASKRLKSYELYNLFKKEKNRIIGSYSVKNDRRRGIIDALYDLMNFVSRG